MITHIRVGGRLPLKALALLVGVSVLSRGSAMADDNDPVVTNQVQTNPDGHTRASIFSTAPKASAPWATAHPASNLASGL